MKARLKQIGVANTAGPNATRIAVTPDWRKGSVAVHKAINSTTFWTATHIPTGYAIRSYVASKRKAVAMANWFSKECRRLRIPITDTSPDRLEKHRQWTVLKAGFHKRYGKPEW